MPITIQGATMIMAGDVGDLGFDWGSEDYFTYAETVDALARIGSAKRVTVRLNSGGGLATEGIAIASAIQGHPGGCDVIVEGIAASAASVIACAGTLVTVSLGAVMMVHEASTVTLGTAEAMETAVRVLETLNASYASIYARKTGKAHQAMRELMASETWLTADQAVAEGFADAVAGKERQPVGYAYANYKHPPASLLAIRPRPRLASSRPAQPPPPSLRVSPAPADAEPPPGASTFTRDDAVEIATLCMDAEMPHMASSLIREGVSTAVARVRIDAIGQTRSLLALMRRAEPRLEAQIEKLEADAQRGRLTLQQARQAFFDAAADADQALEITNHKLTGDGNGGAKALSRSVMNKLVAEMTGKKAK